MSLQGPKIVPLNLTLPSNIPGYLNVMPDETGFNHIALFSPPNATEPIFITKGDWEVDGLPFVNYDRGNVYVQAGRRRRQLADHACIITATSGPRTLRQRGTTLRYRYRCTTRSLISSGARCRKSGH